jgi:hypothetical protein
LSAHAGDLRHGYVADAPSDWREGRGVRLNCPRRSCPADWEVGFQQCLWHRESWMSARSCLRPRNEVSRYTPPLSRRINARPAITASSTMTKSPVITATVVCMATITTSVTAASASRSLFTFPPGHADPPAMCASYSRNERRHSPKRLIPHLLNGIAPPHPTGGSWRNGQLVQAQAFELDLFR